MTRGSKRNITEWHGNLNVGAQLEERQVGWAVVSVWAARQGKAEGVGGPAGLEKKKKGNPLKIDF
jgi:hypothetical protein